MRKLILVKHAKPVLVSGKPANSWLLSEEGRKSCPALAERLREHQPDIIITSSEPKANETGLLVSEALGIPFETAPGLHEHERSTTPLINDPAAWEALVKEFFERPDELVFGDETASQARVRFSDAIDTILNQYPEETLVIACHGTVISLYAGQVAGVDPFPLWQRLHLPSYVVFSRPDMEILEIVEKIS
ncbi:histidine phosphatase family protein [soil metagenome]